MEVVELEREGAPLLVSETEAEEPEGAGEGEWLLRG